jgi:oxygen-independent coproporphyrinogen-3 oxidase
MRMIDSDLTRLALYLHIPFCSSKCGYCDFNSYEGLDHLVPEYTPAILSEIELWGAAATQHEGHTIFFGGGTPSLTDISDIEAIIAAVKKNYRLTDDVEWSLEANPTELTLVHLQDLRKAGINRLSMGVQSLQTDELKLLDRDHTPERVFEAFADARSAGFKNINLDLMFGLPDQKLETWQDTVKKTLSMEPDHLSCYALTVEPGTALYYQVQKGLVVEPDPDVAADQYEWTQEELGKHGYSHYEISNWARPGKECLHNLVYWRAQPYLGMGAGAHSFFAGQRFANIEAPNRYIDAVGATKLQRMKEGKSTMQQIAAGETPDKDVILADAMILGLRLLKGINEINFEMEYGVKPSELYAESIEKHLNLGLLIRDGNWIKLTPNGLLLSNEVFIDLLPAENKTLVNVQEQLLA